MHKSPTWVLALLLLCGCEKADVPGSGKSAEGEGSRPAENVLALTDPADRKVEPGLFYIAADGKGQPGGLRPEKIFRTLSEAVAEARPGNTLVVAPGIYEEEVILAPGGDAEKPITIRSQVPGWAELRGSVSVTEWETLPEHEQIYRAPLDRVAHLVIEVDTGTFYREVANIGMVAESPGSFFYDKESSRLFIHPTSGLAENHVIEASVLATGIAGRDPEIFGSRSPIYAGWIIEGLTLWGYYDAGIYLPNADRCEVRDCTVSFSGRGIFFENAAGSAIRGCRAFSCHTPFNREMGGIAIRGYFANCVIEDNVVHNTPDNGIRFYGAHYGVTMRNNLAFDCRVGIQLKGEPYTRAQLERHLGDFSGFRDIPDDLDNILEGNVAHRATGGEAALIAHKSSFRHNTGIPTHSAVARNMEGNLELQHGDVEAALFADPAYHDMRLQSDSPWRDEDGKGLGAYRGDAAVRYVGPEGDDDASGTSVSEAWGSLPVALERLVAGQTLYILPGIYASSIHLSGLHGTADAPTRIRAHGKGEGVIDGGEELADGVLIKDCTHLSIEGLAVLHTTRAAVSIQNSGFVLLEENVISDNAGDGIVLAGNCPDVSLVTNIIMDNAGSGLEIAPDAAGLHVAGLTLRGNALQMSAPDGLPALWRSDRNNIGGGPVADVAGIALTSLDDWRATTGQDSRSGDFEPEFVERTDVSKLVLRKDSPSRGRGHLGGAVGTSRVLVEDSIPLRFEQVAVLDLRPDSADLTWTTPSRNTTRLVAYGTDPENLDNLLVHDLSFHFGRQHSVTLHDLEPGQQIYFRVGDRRLTESFQPFHDYRYKWPERGPDITMEEYASAPKVDTFDEQLRNFVTPLEYAPPVRVFHVSPTGNDASEGTEQAPWQTLGKASEMVQAGDRVVVSAGTYPETIRPLRSGMPGAPIIFEAAPGERVQIDGARELVPSAVELVNKAHIAIRGFVFQGQRERGFHHDDNGQVLVVDSRDILVEDCVFDGRMNYVTSLRIHRSRDVTAKNNIFVSHHHAIEASDNTGLIAIDHNSLLGPTELAIYAIRNDQVKITNNLINECLYPKKKLQYRVRVIRNREVEMDHNVYVFNSGNDERRAVDFGGPLVDVVAATGLPERDEANQAVRVGIKGDLRQWQEEFGQGRNSVIVEDDPGWVNSGLVSELRGRQRKWPDRNIVFPPFDQKEVVLKSDSPLYRAGREGRPIGASWPAAVDVADSHKTQQEQ